jgi:hypothetical protein
VIYEFWPVIGAEEDDDGEENDKNFADSYHISSPPKLNILAIKRARK